MDKKQKNKKGLSLQFYTLRYLIVALLGIIAIWAGLFYAVMLEEVYDNIDDGLKNSKLLIIREAYANPKILETKEFGINQFKIQPLTKGQLYDFSDKFINTFEFMEYDDDNEPVRLLETVFNDPAGNPYKLTIRASMVEEDELMEDLFTALIALYIMLVISIALLNHIILRKVWKSFYLMLEKLKSFKLGAGSKFEAPHSPVAEFTALGHELENMLKRNEAIYSSQKQFIENASHELQTPLAVSLNKLDLFADNQNLTEEQLMEIGKISDSLNRLVRLNKSLLMLSKIENRQYADEENVLVNEVVRQLTEDFEDLAEYKEVNITVQENAQLNFTMNRGLAITLVSNLLKNAIVHNHKGGTIAISINKNSLSLQNTGSPNALPAEYVFKRFYRQSDNDQSTGLGLSIVQSIVNNYSLKVDYLFNGSHSFTITFPEKL
jgi:signal transduction histidine kinase